MDKAKLIEKLKAMPLTQKQIEAILASLTAPVPDGKVTDEEIELAGLELQRRIKDRITTFNWTFKEGAKWMHNKLTKTT